MARGYFRRVSAPRQKAGLILAPARRHFEPPPSAFLDTPVGAAQESASAPPALALPVLARPDGGRPVAAVPAGAAAVPPEPMRQALVSPPPSFRRDEVFAPVPEAAVAPAPASDNRRILPPPNAAAAPWPGATAIPMVPGETPPDFSHAAVPGPPFQGRPESPIGLVPTKNPAATPIGDVPAPAASRLGPSETIVPPDRGEPPSPTRHAGSPSSAEPARKMAAPGPAGAPSIHIGVVEVRTVAPAPPPAPALPARPRAAPLPAGGLAQSYGWRYGFGQS
jgi:hypothetical protein